MVVSEAHDHTVKDKENVKLSRSVKNLIILVVAYSFTKATKPSSANFIPLLHSVDEIGKGGDQTYEPINPRVLFLAGPCFDLPFLFQYVTEIAPHTMRAQLIFYSVITLFSSSISNGAIMTMSAIVQMTNLLCTVVIIFPPLRTIWMVKLGVISHGMSVATTNVFQTLCYSLFEKSLIQKVVIYSLQLYNFCSCQSGWVKMGQQLGQLFGSIIGATMSECLHRKNSKLFGYLIEYKNVEKAKSSLNRYSMYFYASTYGISMIFVAINTIIYTRFPKPPKKHTSKPDKAETSALAAIIVHGSTMYSLSYSQDTFVIFKNEECFYLAICWCFSMITMVQSKTFCSSLWNEQINRLNVLTEKNSLFDGLSTLFGAFGAMLPAILVDKFVKLLFNPLICLQSRGTVLSSLFKSQQRLWVPWFWPLISMIGAAFIVTTSFNRW